jgi:hypothetical protein
LALELHTAVTKWMLVISHCDLIAVDLWHYLRHLGLMIHHQTAAATGAICEVVDKTEFINLDKRTRNHAKPSADSFVQNFSARSSHLVPPAEKNQHRRMSETVVAYDTCKHRPLRR